MQVAKVVSINQSIKNFQSGLSKKLLQGPLVCQWTGFVHGYEWLYRLLEAPYSTSFLSDDTMKSFHTLASPGLPTVPNWRPHTQGASHTSPGSGKPVPPRTNQA